MTVGLFLGTALDLSAQQKLARGPRSLEFGGSPVRQTVKMSRLMRNGSVHHGQVILPARVPQPLRTPAAGTASIMPQPGNVRLEQKRFSDYNLPGLEKPVFLLTIDPWEVVQLIEFLALEGNLQNVVIAKNVSGLTTKLRFNGITVGEAMEIVLSINHLAFQVSNGVITIMTDDEYRTLYGRSFYDHKQVRIIELKYADPDHVAAMLSPVKSLIGTIVPDPVTGTLILIDTPEKIAEMQAVIRTSDIPTVSRVMPMETKPFVLQYAHVDDIREGVAALLTKEIGTLHTDRRSKTLIVTDLPHNMKRIEQIIRHFDVRPKQVFIEAKIVQVTLNDDFRLGIDWEHLANYVSPRFSLGASAKPPISGLGGRASTAVGSGMGSLTYRTIMQGGDLTIILDALREVGETKILSNPHVAVLDGQEATIKVVTDKPYVEAQLDPGTTNVVAESLQFIEVGVSLSVKPEINDAGFISVDIKPTVSTVEDTYAARYPVPVVRKSSAQTSVMIKDGQTIIIAGMIEDRNEKRDTRVPLLSRIPVFGLLFRSESDFVETKETVVFLTPRIMTGTEPVTRLRDMKKSAKPLRKVGGTGGKKMRPIR